MLKLLNITIMSGDNGFTKAMRSVCDEYEEIAVSMPGLNERILAVASADLVFVQIQATGILPESITWLKSLGAYIIQWSGDKRDGLPHWYVDYASWGVDLNCFSNMADVRTMRAFGHKAEFLQIGYDPALYFPGTGEGGKEIVFMGNNCGGFPLSEMRRDMVTFLRAEYGSRLGLYGSGWDDADGNFNGDQIGEAEVYMAAKIGINLSHFDTDRYTSDRMFRMMGCGVCVLSHNFHGAKEMFPGVGRWDNFEEMKDHIDWYLENENLRQSAANYWHLLAITKYTFENMAENIIRLWKKHK